MANTGARAKIGSEETKICPDGITFILSFKILAKFRVVSVSMWHGKHLEASTQKANHFKFLPHRSE